MRIHLCGVRGSCPTSGQDFAGVGLHTSCVAVAHDGERPTLVLDAGSGLRDVTKLLCDEPFHGTLLLGHMHWDHLLGLPFFGGGDRSGSRVEVLVPEQGVPALDLVTRAMSPPLFPISPAQLQGDWSFATYDESTFVRSGFTITAREITHTGGRTMGLRISDGTSTIAYLSDHAPHVLGPGPWGVGEVTRNVIELVEGADLLLHDAQYTRAELPGRMTWGHAAADYPARLAEAYGVRRFLMFHHDPSRTDVAVRALRDEVAGDGPVDVGIAVEGDVIDL